MNHRVLFLHIPKTAGRYIWSLIQQVYPEEQLGYWAPHCIIGSLKCNPAELHQKYVIGGHFVYGMDGLFTDDKPLKKFTILRDPVDRVVSHYKYLSREHREIDLMALEDFLSHKVVMPFVNNIQVRIIGSPWTVPDLRRIIQGPSLNSLDSSIGQVLAYDLRYGDLEGSLERAKARLESGSLSFGLKEHLRLSMSKFGHLGLELPEIDERTHNRYGLLLETHDRIADLNWADIELYNFAQELFWEKNHDHSLSARLPAG